VLGIKWIGYKVRNYYQASYLDDTTQVVHMDIKKMAALLHFYVAFGM